MTHRILALSAATAALLLTGCDHHDGDHGARGHDQAAVDAIKATESNMAKAFSDKDASALTSHYAADAVLAVPGRTVTGIDAIGKANAEDLKDPAFKLALANHGADASDDLGYTTGSYTVSYTDPKTKQVVNGAGTYVTVFKKQSDGTWKAVADIATQSGG
jgi:ketosteroid isomerase-like protein